MSANQLMEPSNKRKRVTSIETEGSRRITDTHRKRNPRACDRCRLKKAKCSGGTICGRCRHDTVVCVTTSAPKRDEYPPRPGYVHLIESQRDQLAQALQKVLEGRDTSDLAKMKTILADMGVTVDDSDVADASLDNGDDQDLEGSILSSFQTISPSWDDFFNNLDEPQSEAMTSFSLVTTPPVPESSLETSSWSSNLDDPPLGAHITGNLQAPSGHLELANFLQMHDSEGGTISLSGGLNEPAYSDLMLLFQ